MGETIGLATSVDGIHFTKHEANPVLDARCPYAVVHEGRVHLFHVRTHEGGYRIHLATSDDGVRFDAGASAPVLTVGPPGAWDSRSVTTPKVFPDGDGGYCMTYAGDDGGLDDPSGIGLAVSTDLAHWSKVDGNPVLTRGPTGAWDCASVAAGILCAVGDRLALVYAGSDRTVADGLHSQVGIAWLAR